MSEKKIIFDFDGVIVDSFAMGLALTRRLDNPEIADGEYRSLFLGNIFETGPKKKLPTFDSEVNRQNYYQHYRAGLMQLSVVPGMDALIEELASRHQLHIVSSANEPSLEDFLKTWQLRHHFQSVLGYETAESKVVKFKMLNLHERPESHLFITDTLGDLKEAAKVGLPSIAVSWGVHNEETLQAGNPLAVVHSVNELQEELLKWRAA